MSLVGCITYKIIVPDVYKSIPINISYYGSLMQDQLIEIIKLIKSLVSSNKVVTLFLQVIK